MEGQPSLAQKRQGWGVLGSAGSHLVMEGTSEHQWGSTSWQDKIKSFNGYLWLSYDCSEKLRVTQLSTRFPTFILSVSFIFLLSFHIIRSFTELLCYWIRLCDYWNNTKTTLFHDKWPHKAWYTSFGSYCIYICQKLNLHDCMYVTWDCPYYMQITPLLGSEFFINLFIRKGQSEMHS